MIFFVILLEISVVGYHAYYHSYQGQEKEDQGYV